MKVTPKTEEELNNVWPEGVYPFEVVDAEETISKKGAEMIKLKLDFGRGKVIFDYLMDSFPPKIAHACRYMGLEAEYKAGYLPANVFVGKTGYAKLTKQESDKYGVQNNVADYMSHQEGSAAAVAEAAHDDTIPF